MADFSPDALSSEGIYCQTQLRNHQIVDGPILSQRRGYADLSYGCCGSAQQTRVTGSPTRGGTSLGGLFGLQRSTENE